MAIDERTAETSAAGRNRLTPLRFVVTFGVVSMLADVVYEGARSISGPFLASLGASAVLVGFVTGFGEAVALGFRFVTGRVSDRTGRHWALSIAGYAITLVAVPLLAAAQALWQAAALIVAERFGKAVRAPARDTMLSQAGASLGRGWAFAVHEALDQSGAVSGPLLVAGMVAVSGFKLAFAVLAIPGVFALLVLARLRLAVPRPETYEREHDARLAAAEGAASAPAAAAGAPHAALPPSGPPPFPRRFWLYAGFTALSMLGFATFALLGYHLEVRHVVASALIPVVYAVAMAAAVLAALASGRLYDRRGLRALVALPPLAAIVPLLSFSTTPALIWAGAIVWGAAMGIHESTMRAAVADLVPAARRGAGYGTFTAVYGLAWLAGGVLVGVLYERSVTDVVVFTAIVQALALVAFVPLWPPAPTTRSTAPPPARSPAP
jgi:MFS family permease